MRAASAACTVSGSASASELGAARARTISSRKNGFPSARATISARASSPITASSRSSARRMLSLASSGSTASPVKLRRPPPQVGRRAVSSGRAVQRKNSGPAA